VPTIRNPVEWTVDQARHVADAVGATAADVQRAESLPPGTLPAVAEIGVADLWEALSKGIADFAAARTDVMLLCLFYPAMGLVLGRLASGADTMPLLFPLISGFALVAPFVAVGLYEMSRQREQGRELRWATVFEVVNSPSFGAIVTLGAILTVIFLLWLSAAEAIYGFTLGPAQPTSILSFMVDVLTKPSGWAMAAIGIGVGFVFALVVFSISVVSFPLLLDRDVGLGTAVWTSARATVANPLPMAVWAMIIAIGLVIGSLPFLLGLSIVLPVLGHASWHLYRKLMRSP